MRLHIGPSGFRPLFWVSYIQTLQMILHHPTQKEWWLHKAKQSMSEPSVINTSASIVVVSLNQWNSRMSLSPALMRTCRNACLRSPANVIGLRRFWTSTSQWRFWREGPVSKQSSSEGLFLLALVEALYTILSLVDSAYSLMTGL